MSQKTNAYCFGRQKNHWPRPLLACLTLKSTRKNGINIEYFICWKCAYYNKLWASWKLRHMRTKCLRWTTQMSPTNYIRSQLTRRHKRMAMEGSVPEAAVASLSRAYLRSSVSPGDSNSDLRGMDKAPIFLSSFAESWTYDMRVTRWQRPSSKF